MDGLHSLYNLPAIAHPESGPRNHPAPPPPREPHMHTCQDEVSGRARMLAARCSPRVHCLLSELTAECRQLCQLLMFSAPSSTKLLNGLLVLMLLLMLIHSSHEHHQEANLLYFHLNIFFLTYN